MNIKLKVSVSFALICAMMLAAIGGIKVRISAASSTAITEDNGSVDFGCPVDANLMTEGENPYENFYDLTLLSEKMNEYFGNK